MISIEGNIGAGKTTAFKALQKFYKDVEGYTFVSEPVSEWTDAYGTGVNILGRFYQDQKREAFTTQMLILDTQISHMEKAVNSGASVIITDRSIFTAKECFARLLQEEEKLDPVQWIIYNNMITRLEKNIPRLDGVIYVRATADICLQRINARAREEEVNATVQLYDYLQKLEAKHEMWLGGDVSFEVEVIDSEMLDFKKNGSDREQTIKKMVQFIEKRP